MKITAATQIRVPPILENRETIFFPSTLSVFVSAVLSAESDRKPLSPERESFLEIAAISVP